METANITITSAEQGEQLSIAGGNYRFLITGEETGNRFAVIEMIVPPGAGPAPHAHPDIQETFYVADGQVEFRTEEGKQVAASGAFINIPFNGGVHAFKNISDKPVRLICTVTPAGLERLFREISGLSPQEVRAVAEKYIQKLYPPDYLD
ncbi:MAG TPA: cupin domain-containing protein [Mucilaginibacter sp.]|nr:cupin domain-containing protein [Mucilaginibacter sp.]